MSGVQFEGGQNVELETGTKSVEPSAGIAMATDLCSSVELKSITCICKDDIVQFESDQNRKYTCGGCLRRFITVCGLHDHLKLHGSGGSYHFDHVSNTAFPKYDTFCSFTQTDMDLYEGRADAPVASLSDPGDNVSDNYDQDDNVSEHSDQEITVPANTDQEITVPENTDQEITVSANTDQEITVSANTDCDVNVSPVSAKRKNDKRTKVKAEKDSPIKTAKVILKDINESVKDAIKKGLVIKDLKVTDCVKRVPVNDGKVSVSRPPRTLRKRTQPCPKLGKNLAKKRKEVVIDSDEDFEVDTEDMDESEDEFHDRLDHSRSRCFSDEQTAKQNTNCKIKVEHQQKLLPCKAEDESNQEKDIEIKCEIEVKNDLHEDNQMQLKEKTNETFALTLSGDSKPVHNDTKPKKQLVQKKNKKGKGGVWTCEICNRIWKFKYDLQRHMATHTRSPKPEKVTKKKGTVLSDERKAQLTCEVCNKVSKDSYAYRRHKKMHLRHPELFTKLVTNIEPPEKCESLKTEEEKSGKQKEKADRLTCDICQKSMKSKSRFNRHRLTHFPNVDGVATEGGGETRRGPRPKVTKQVICEQCGQSFRRDKLRSHQIRQHAAVKPWACTLCPSRFCDKATLNTHMARHRGDRTYACTACEKVFYSSKYLRYHMQTEHMGVTRFECEHCGRRFYLRCDMLLHQAIHFEPTLQCRFCERKFKEKSSLIRHERIHSGVPVYRCHICDHGFVQCTAFYVHMEKRHDLNRPLLKEMLKEVREANKLAGIKGEPLMLPRDTDNLMLMQLRETEQSVRSIPNVMITQVQTSATACDYGQIIKTETLPMDNEEINAQQIKPNISSGSQKQEAATKMMPVSTTFHNTAKPAGEGDQLTAAYNHMLHRDLPSFNPGIYLGQHHTPQGGV